MAYRANAPGVGQHAANPASKHLVLIMSSSNDSRKISANAAPKITADPAMFPRIISRRRHNGAARSAPAGSGAISMSAIHCQFNPFTASSSPQRAERIDLRRAARRHEARHRGNRDDADRRGDEREGIVRTTTNEPNAAAQIVSEDCEQHQCRRGGRPGTVMVPAAFTSFQIRRPTLSASVTIASSSSVSTLWFRMMNCPSTITDSMSDGCPL